MSTPNYFAALAAINVNEHIEKKGGFSYLSWPYAVSQLRLADPTATWEVRRFDGLPFLQTEAGFFVEVAVTVQGVTLSQIHPVLDGKNRPLLAPTAFDINTSIQRCLVKAIALHGLGLYVYAGEDLPNVGDAANDEAAGTGGALTKPTESPAPPLPRSGTISSFQQSHVRRLMTENRVDEQRLFEYFGIRSLAEIRTADFPRVLRAVEKRRA